jgi:glucose/arabinose dehydrogenase
VTRRFAITLACLAVLVSACAGGGGSGSKAQTEPQTEPRAATPQAAATHVRLLRLGTFSSPTFLTAPPGDRHRRFVVERAGRIIVLVGRHRLKTPFLDIRGLVSTGGERGLLSMAFAPDYSKSHRFYVYYTDNAGFVVVAQFRRSASSPNRAVRSSRRQVIRVPHHNFNHKGGQLEFGPDHMLYLGIGDGGSEGDPQRNGQNKSTLLGKLLRIDPKAGGGYTIPRSNPFVGKAGRDEIYAYGLRNPWRFSFDRRKGHLTIGDVGQDAWEEVDFIPNTRGRGHAPRGGYNFGWSVFEGTHHYNAGSAPGHRRPVLQHSHKSGYCTVIGGYVVRDRALGSLYGRYVYGDLCRSDLRVVRLGRRRARGDRALGPKVKELVSFGEDARGRLYAVSLNGPVYRIARR